MAENYRNNGRHSRLRRAHKDWVKGNRDRAQRIDPESETVTTGQERMRPKAITIFDISDVDELPRGQVVETQSGRYDVKLESGEPVVLACRIKRGVSTANDQSTLIAVGDFVRVQPLEGDHGLIHHVEERHTRLGRTAAGQQGMEHVLAANVDTLFCITSADRPDFRRTILDRYIVAAHLGGVMPVIILNKMDTVDGELRELLEEEMAVYSAIGYEVLLTSTVTGEGIDDLRESIRDRLCVLIGQSGVGKSSLMNAVLGRDERRTAEVREKDRRGTHTTISSVMLAAPGGGHLIDTPGLREFGIWDLEPEELDAYFIEFLDYLRECRFLPCTHTHEPGCAVRDAVERGDIDEGRYASYLAIFESLKQETR